MAALVPSLAVEAKNTISKFRELPLAGEILCKVGDTVQAEEVIARAELPGDLQVLRLADRTGLAPEVIIKSLKIKEGDSIEQGDLLMEYSGLFGLFKTSVAAPFAGVVEFITESNAHIALRAEPRVIELKAYISGVVQEIVNNQVVRIETEASFMQGIFGIGGERFGELNMLSNQIPGSAEGQVLVFNSTPSIQDLERVAQSGANGLIIPSIEDKVLKDFLGYDLGLAITGNEDVPFTLIITEGFGDLKMSERHLELFTQLAGSSVSINGATQVRAGAIRPEVIVSNTKLSASSKSSSKNLEVGSKIKIIRFPYFGINAKVVELPNEPELLDTGGCARVLRAKERTGKVLTVPRANVELR